MIQNIGQVIHNSKTTSPLLENNFSYSNRSNSSNSQKDNDKFKVDYSSLIDTALVPEAWVDRHYKVIHKIGPAAYDALVYKAKRYGRNPQALLCKLINTELARAV